MTFSQRSRRLAIGATAVVALALAAVPAIAADHAVSIVDKSFDPKDITIAAGDTVTWTVTKSIGEPHSVTSGKVGDADAGSKFDSGITLKDDGQTFQQTFDTPGTYDYFCTVHSAEMTGVITVEASGESAAPSGAASGEPSPSSAPASQPAGSPGGSEGPAASAEPEVHEPVPAENRLIGGAILIAALVILFGLNMLWRRVNKA